MNIAAELNALFAGLDRARGRCDLTGEVTESGKAKGDKWVEHKPITETDWVNHLNGKAGLGVFPLRDDGTCGWAAIDVDQYDIDIKEIEQRVKRLNFPLIVLRSSSGGAHLYIFFKTPAAAKRARKLLTKWSAKLGFPGVEIFPKHDKLASQNNFGNWLNMPYMNHERTTRYAIKDGKALSVNEFLAYAKEMQTTIEDAEAINISTEQQVVSSTPQIDVFTSSIVEGNRNSELTRLAGVMWHKGMSEETILAALLLDNSSRCIPPLSKKEIQTIVKSISKYPRGGDSEHLTDVGNANRLVQRHGANIRWVPDVKKWLIWSGHYWLFDDDGKIMRLAKDTALVIYQEAANEQDSNKRKSLSNWARTSEGKERLKAMCELARCEVPVRASQLDSNPWLLGVINGVIDLRTGALRESVQEDYITKRALVEYDPSASCPLWFDYLDTVTAGDAELIGFLQRAAGYSLTGSISEQCMFLLHGVGANGKSVFLTIILNLTGDYGTQTSPETLMVKRDGSVPNDIARLRGTRFVATSEVEEGKRLAEALVKQMTGGDVLVARFLHAEFFEFLPQFKIWLAANHKPIIRGDDYAIWRRIHLIPFEVTIPEEDRDKELTTKLTQELPGILNWALEGCRQWQREGLNPPDKVKAATEEYRTEMDVLRAWISECCVTGANKSAGATDLYNSYKRWAETNTGWLMKQAKFGRKMTDHGFKKEKGARVVYQGIGLQIDEEPY